MTSNLSPSAWMTVWITGASSGIGRQLALDLADSGARVAVSSRDAGKLEALARDNANLHPYPLDVTDLDACRAQGAKIAQDLGTPDLAINCAGVWELRDAGDFDARASARLMDINYQGAVNLTDTCLGLMKPRGRGQIALMGSVVGYRSVPRSAAYAPTKAAVISLAEALRPDAARFGIKISVMNPGFVNTPMTHGNDFDMPFIIEPSEASRHIRAGLKAGRFEIVFPPRLALVMKIMRLLPYRVYFFLMKHFLLNGRHGLGRLSD